MKTTIKNCQNIFGNSKLKISFINGFISQEFRLRNIEELNNYFNKVID